MEAPGLSIAGIDRARFAVVAGCGRRQGVAFALRVAEVNGARIGVVTDELASAEAPEAEVVDGTRAERTFARLPLAFRRRHAQGRPARNIRAGVRAWRVGGARATPLPRGVPPPAP